jgi:hypothetical protein
MKTTMPRFHAHFADAISKGDTFSLRRDGDSPVKVYAPPINIKNLVGERRHVILHVHLLDDDRKTGRMIFSPSNVVYVLTEES